MSRTTEVTRNRDTALTSQQQAAMRRDVSIALSAGAGCGKTFVLTQRFLSHLEPHDGGAELSQLVAITFTERAAREMRDRVRRECRRRLLSCPADEVDHWQGLVRELDTARISTIHSFCASLLRTHAVEARVDPRFVLLDEITGSALLRQAIETGLTDRLSATDPDTLELVYEFGLERLQKLLGNLIPERYRLDLARWKAVTPKELAALWQQRWQERAVPQLLRDIAEAPETGRLLRLLADNIPNNATMQSRRLVLLDALPELPKAADPPKALAELREAAQIRGGGTKTAWESEAVYEAVRDSLADLRDQLDRVAELLEVNSTDTLRGADLGLRTLRLTIGLGERYDQLKREAAALDFDDLLLRARDLLRDHDNVRRRAAAGIALLMVDEFQDTDPIQAEIVNHLCGEHLLTGRLFLVGDIKQSIYRFRRAEPRVFRHLRQQIPEGGRLPLSTNFRSQPAILRFVNVLFDGALGDEYEPLVPPDSVQQLSPQPCIEFLFAAATLADETIEDDLAPLAAEEDESAADRRRREGEWIARRLKQLLSDGVPRVRERDAATGTFHLRTLQPRDVVLLFRAMTDVRHCEEALRRHGLDYYVVGGRAFYAQQEVFDIVNLCRCLDDPDDEVALTGVLRSPFFSLSDDGLFALTQIPARDHGSPAGEHSKQASSRRRLPLFNAIQEPPPTWLSDRQRERIALAGSVLRELRELKDRLPLAGLLSLAVERTGYDAALLTEFLGVRKLANLRKLIDMARQFDQSGLFTLADFVDQLQQAVGEEVKEPLAATHPESSNVIRLMSIHQSKGLEFPLVVVVDMDRRGNDLPAPAHLDPELGPLVSLPEKFGQPRKNLGMKLLRLSERDETRAETLRLLYVAATRAADHLIFSANLKEPGQVTHPWLKLLASRFDLLTGQPRSAPTVDGVSILTKYSRSLPEIRVHHQEPELVAIGGSGQHRHVTLDTLRATIESASPIPLPPSLTQVAPDYASRTRFSITEIAGVDAKLRGLDLSAAGEWPDERLPDEDWKQDEPGVALPGDAAKKLGTLVHSVLERVDFAAPEEWRELLSREVSASRHKLAEETVLTAARCIEALLASNLADELASARSLQREIEFLLKWPTTKALPETSHPVLLNGILDCLFVNAAGDWVILDFKTGRYARGGEQAVFATYEIQLAAYALAVREWLGRWPARVELVLLRSGASRVGFDCQTADWNELHCRVDDAIASLRRP